jgi:uncharacterized protein with PQ loop repeat
VGSSPTGPSKQKDLSQDRSFCLARDADTNPQSQSDGFSVAMSRAGACSEHDFAQKDEVRCPTGSSATFSVIFRLMFIKTNKKQKREILEIAYFVAVVQPIMVLPQAVQIFAHHSARDVSLLTWAMLLIFNTSNFIYALVFNIKPIIINNAIWMLVDAAVVIGVLLYH